MAEYKSMKIPIKIWEIYAKYVETFNTVYDNPSTMIQDIIKEKAKDLLNELNAKLQNTKSQLTELNERIQNIESEFKKQKDVKESKDSTNTKDSK
jgi:F0F1-type ATP synthase membrane subunit b/b'